MKIKVNLNFTGEFSASRFRGSCFPKAKIELAEKWLVEIAQMRQSDWLVDSADGFVVVIRSTRFQRRHQVVFVRFCANKLVSGYFCYYSCKRF